MKKKLLASILFLLLFMITFPVYGSTYSQRASKENPKGSWNDVKAEDKEIVVQIHIEDTGYYQFSPMTKDLKNYIIYVYNAKLDTKDESKLTNTLKPPFDFSDPIYCQTDSYMTFIYTPDPEYIPGSFFIGSEYVGETYEPVDDPLPDPCYSHDFKVIRKNPATFTEDGSIDRVCINCLGDFGIDIAKVSNVKLSETSYVYNGKSQRPKLVVKDRLGKTLKSGRDYHLKYDKNSKSIGAYTVKLTLAGNYKGSKVYTYKILPKSNAITVIKGLKKGLKVTWTKSGNITGYEIRYSVNRKMTKAKIIKVGSKNLSKTISGLSKGRKYYAQVRTYKVVKKKVYPSAWSKIKSVKIR